MHYCMGAPRMGVLQQEYSQSLILDPPPLRWYNNYRNTTPNPYTPFPRPMGSNYRNQYVYLIERLSALQYCSVDIHINSNKQTNDMEEKVVLEGSNIMENYLVPLLCMLFFSTAGCCQWPIFSWERRNLFYFGSR